MHRPRHWPWPGKPRMDARAVRRDFPMRSPILFEACVDSVEGALTAERGGAGRVELCANLPEGGTTPSHGLLAETCARVRIPVQAMVRPRGGDFLYSDLEFAVMRRDLEVARDCGAHGIVCGMLMEDGRLDRRRMEELVRLARPLGVTCHRAFDMTRDPFEALEDLIALGVERVLTSGQRQTALEGLDLLTKLVQQARGRIQVMPGGSITEFNVAIILKQTRANEVHAYPRTTSKSRMHFQNSAVAMNNARTTAEFTRIEISLERVQAIVQAIQLAT